MKLKITKERLDQIMQEEYQRIQEGKSTEEELEAEYKAAKQKLDKGATTEDRLDGLKALEDMFLKFHCSLPLVSFEGLLSENCSKNFLVTSRSVSSEGWRIGSAFTPEIV